MTNIANQILNQEGDINNKDSPEYTKMKEFDLEEILNRSRNRRKRSLGYGALDNNSKFLLLCSRIKKHIDDEWNKEQNQKNQKLLLKGTKTLYLANPQK